MDLHAVTAALVDDLSGLRFGLPVSHVYNPLLYAAEPWRLYLERYGLAPRDVILLGMNPGPWGLSNSNEADQGKGC